MSYRLTPFAKSNLKQIWTYTYKIWGEKQADKYTDSIKESILCIVNNREKGRSRDEVSLGLKSCKVEHHLIFYFITASEVEVVGILHTKMDPCRHL